jgi:hypothetical protein
MRQMVRVKLIFYRDQERAYLRIGGHLSGCESEVFTEVGQT